MEQTDEREIRDEKENNKKREEIVKELEELFKSMSLSYICSVIG